MEIINGQHLTYNHTGDAGYDLHLNLKEPSDNSYGFLFCLEQAHTANLNWHRASGGYLPKLYVNGKKVGEYENKRELDLFINLVREQSLNGYKIKEPFLLLPPARVSQLELASCFANYLNTELVSTSFDFIEPNKIEIDSLPKKPHNMSVAGFVYPRSGLGAKHQITVANNVGVIDLGYRNNVMVALENRGRDIHMFTNGSKIAQLVLGVILDNGYNLNPLEDESRGYKGFGSTGVNS